MNHYEREARNRETPHLEAVVQLIETALIAEKLNGTDPSLFLDRRDRALNFPTFSQHIAARNKRAAFWERFDIFEEARLKYLAAKEELRRRKDNPNE